MSYRFKDCRYLSGKLTIRRDVVLANRDDREGKWKNHYLAEINFLEDITMKSPEVVEIDRPGWSGEGSRDFDPTLLDILKHTQGNAELVLTGEDGDQVGIRVREGKVKVLMVKVSLESYDT